jgi:hypothetical protein
MEVSCLIYRLTNCALIAASLLAGGDAAAGARSAASQTPTNLPGVSVVAPPPTSYNPIAGKPLANTQFALPPAPSAHAAPGAYAAWQSAVTAAQNRETPVLTPTNIFNGPIQGKPPSSARSPAQ